jgi:predicted protein tyrosine phosphatase
MTTTHTATLLATLQKANDLLHELRAHDLTDPDSESTMAEIEAALAGQAIPPVGETEPDKTKAERASEFVMEDYRTLANGLRELIDGGRLTASDLPDDFEWIEVKLSYLAAHDPGQGGPLERVRERYSARQGEA